MSQQSDIDDEGDIASDELDKFLIIFLCLLVNIFQTF